MSQTKSNHAGWEQTAGAVLPSCRPGTLTRRRIACVGDSITWGTGVHNRARNSYPAVLGELLGKGFALQNFGVSGATLLRKGNKPYWTTPRFRAATEFCRPGTLTWRAPHAVVIALGTNDSKPRNWKFKPDFASDLRSLIEHFRQLPTRPTVWVCLPPPAIAADGDGINEAVVSGEIIPLIRKGAKESKTAVIDLHSPLAMHPEYFPDGIHPNATGAKLIAQTVLAALSKKSSHLLYA